VSAGRFLELPIKSQQGIFQHELDLKPIAAWEMEDLVRLRRIEK
jgi:hypothetical protein